MNRRMAQIQSVTSCVGILRFISDMKCTHKFTRNHVDKNRNGRRNTVTPDEQLKAAMRHVPFGSVFSCSNPIASALTLRSMQLFLMLIGLYAIFEDFIVSWSVRQPPVSSRFKFVSLSPRNPMAGAASISIAELGVLHGLAGVGQQGAEVMSQTVEGNEFTILLSNEVRWDTWYFRTAWNESAEYDPVRFQFLVWHDGKWQQAGSSSYLSCSGFLIFLDGLYQTTEERGRLQVFQIFQPDASYYFDQFAKIFCGLILFGAGLCGVVDKKFIGQKLIRIMHPLSFLIHVLEAVFTVSQGGSYSRPRAVALATIDAVHFYFIWNDELSNSIAWGGIHVVLTGIAVYPFVSFGPYSFSAICFYLGLPMLLFALVVKTFRLLTTQSAHRVIQGDKNKYEVIWDKVLAETGDAAFKELKDLSSPFATKRSPKACAVSEFSVLGKLWRFFANRSTGSELRQLDKHGQPVTSLTYLYEQAKKLDVQLRRKTLGWVSSSKGLLRQRCETCLCFPEEDHDIVPYMEGSRVEDYVWAHVKSIQRCVEKVMRCYGGDVSCLLDVCRQCVIFDSVAELTECLRAILKDPDVVVERIKNNLEPTRDSVRSGGYRHVALNLRIASAETREDGTDWHICELQMVLKSFYMLRNERGHARYICFRNIMGE